MDKKYDLEEETVEMCSTTVESLLYGTPIGYIENKDLYDLTASILSQHYCTNSIKESSAIANYLLELLIHKGLIKSKVNHGQAYADVLIAAAYLFNLFYKPGDKKSNLFILRDIIEEKVKNKETNVREVIIESLLETVECQDGITAPGRFKPSPNTPVEDFSNAIWTVRYYEKLNSGI